MKHEAEGIWSVEHRPVWPNRGTGDQTIISVTSRHPVERDEVQLLVSYHRPWSGDEIERLAVARVLADLASYQAAGWDGEEAAAVTHDTLETVGDLLTDLAACGLAMPDTAPAVDGSVCMEWHFTRDRREAVIFIDIGPGRKLMSFARGLGPHSEEKHFDTYDRAAKLHVLTIFDRVTHKTLG
jgi:hypothetical protein